MTNILQQKFRAGDNLNTNYYDKRVDPPSYYLVPLISDFKTDMNTLVLLPKVAGYRFIQAEMTYHLKTAWIEALKLEC